MQIASPRRSKGRTVAAARPLLRLADFRRRTTVALFGDFVVVVEGADYFGFVHFLDFGFVVVQDAG